MITAEIQCRALESISRFVWNNNIYITCLSLKSFQHHFVPPTPFNFYLLIRLFYIRDHWRCILLWLSLVLDDETQYFTQNEDYCSHLPCRARKAFHVIWTLRFRWCNVRLHISVFESPCLCTLQRSVLHPCARNSSFLQTFVTFTKYWLKNTNNSIAYICSDIIHFWNLLYKILLIIRLNIKSAHNILVKY